ncbi:hypothetical protein C0J52_19069 [Blattella germanica]|nr:hypothetical protein C0J52_19069 [Blattella germanica]
MGKPTMARNQNHGVGRHLTKADPITPINNQYIQLNIAELQAKQSVNLISAFLNPQTSNLNIIPGTYISAATKLYQLDMNLRKCDYT